MATGIIYKTTNLLNGKWYIGKDEKNNPKYLGSGVILRKAILKYGRENFKKETIAEATIGKELADLERQIINDTDAVTDTMSYNVSIGGYGGHTWGGYSEEQQQIIKNKMKRTEDQKAIARKISLDNNLSKFMIDGRDKGRREWWTSLSSEEKSKIQSARASKTYNLSHVDRTTIVTNNLQKTATEIGVTYNYILLCIKKNKPAKGWVCKVLEKSRGNS